MRIVIEGEDYNVKVGEWVQTSSHGDCKFILEGSIGDCKVSDYDCKIHWIPQGNIIGLAINPFITSEPALKELSKNGLIKPKMSLIPPLASVEVAKVFTYGAEKYNEYNFSKGAKNTTYIDAALRHINRYLVNEDIDDESKLPHLAHAISCLMMCLDNDLNKTTVENRNKMY